MKRLQREFPEVVLDRLLVLERIERMALQWGTSDGN